MVMLETPPSEIPSVFKAIDGITADLATTEVSADELDRVRKPRIELWRRNLRTNEYWGAVLTNVFDDEDVLIPARKNIEAFTKVTPADLKAVAAAYIRPEKAYRLIVAPDQPVTAAGTRP
jgi:zinc protease